MKLNVTIFELCNFNIDNPPPRKKWIGLPISLFLRICNIISRLKQFLANVEDMICQPLENTEAWDMYFEKKKKKKNSVVCNAHISFL